MLCITSAACSAAAGVQPSDICKLAPCPSVLDETLNIYKWVFTRLCGVLRPCMMVAAQLPTPAALWQCTVNV